MQTTSMKTHNRSLLAAAVALLAATILPASAAPTAALSAKYGTCFACHGADGHAILPTYPNLAGQNKDYLVQTLKQFRDGQRPNDVMGPMAKPLSDSDINQIAMYFAGLRSAK
jgi:cytochrome c553